jgi:cell division protein FtsN
LPEGSAVFRGETNLFLEVANGRYRYMSGPYSDNAAASKAAQAFKQKGFTGAFVTKR